VVAATAPQEEPRRPELGLALSGGGFRAAFFHVGVLARLAETGLLRRVEVISTVSGGSIVGALYYLALKDLLENVADADVRDEHYLQVVRRVERSLFDGVATHLRGRAYADLRCNFRMRLSNYSRSDRLGELYDETFYTPAWNEPLFGAVPAPRLCDGPVRMRELLVRPAGEAEDFKPLRDNGRRRAPVPVLLVNATSLNTGHNWRFQAVEMGEDPRSRDSWVALDKNKRLLSARYEQLAEAKRDFKLGNAVAASACVPGLFHPLALTGLFDGVQVELVDGGVHDNQGVCGLFDTNCERLIVSDASGQMGDLDDPATRVPAAAGRASSIWGDRVREEQLSEALAREGTVLVHLRKGLPAVGVSPLGADGKALDADSQLGVADYGVAPAVQRALAGVRTDLDSFSEVEAYSLSVYAYLMACDELPDANTSYDWALGRAKVDALREQLRDPSAGYTRQLAVARQRFFKAVALTRRMKALAGASLVAALLVLAWCGYLLAGPASDDVPAWSLIVALVVPALLVALYLKQRFRLRPLYRLADGLYTWLLPAALAPFLWVSARIVLLANPAFLTAGRIDAVVADDTAAAPAVGQTV
jgi:predicted acylesterase/phospholipase RssA